MKGVVFYQVGILFLVSAAWIQKPLGNFPDWLLPYELAINCILIAAIAGTLYCLRAVYVNRCVYKNWDPEWETWYFLRPITSSISGLAAYLFLKAGLVVLDASNESGSATYGYLAFAFIAGLNVDKFVLKIEDIAKSTFGIEKSRSANQNKK